MVCVNYRTRAQYLCKIIGCPFLVLNIAILWYLVCVSESDVIKWLLDFTCL